MITVSISFFIIGPRGQKHCLRHPLLVLGVRVTQSRRKPGSTDRHGGFGTLETSTSKGMADTSQWRTKRTTRITVSGTVNQSTKATIYHTLSLVRTDYYEYNRYHRHTTDLSSYHRHIILTPERIHSQLEKLSASTAHTHKSSGHTRILLLSHHF